MKNHPVDAGLILRMPQVSHEGVLSDTEDRVQIGTAVVRELVVMKTVWFEHRRPGGRLY
jgi:hypothetical protein